MIVFLIVLAAILVAADRTLFHLRDSAGWLCEPSSAPRLETGQEEIAFDAARPCLATGVELVAGTTCRFDVSVRSDWMDGDLAANPYGLVDAIPLAMKLATPFSRRLSRPWFELTGRVGQSGGETFAFGDHSMAVLTIGPPCAGCAGWLQRKYRAAGSMSEREARRKKAVAGELDLSSRGRR